MNAAPDLTPGGPLIGDAVAAAERHLNAAIETASHRPDAVIAIGEAYARVHPDQPLAFRSADLIAHESVPQPPTWLIFGSIIASWLGMYLHNVISLPGQNALSPETLWPTLVYLAVIATWLARRRRAAVLGLCAWGWTQLVGGALLSAAPWINQSPAHLATHLLYGTLELPLVLTATPLAGAALRQPPASARRPSRTSENR